MHKSARLRVILGLATPLLQLAFVSAALAGTFSSDFNVNLPTGVKVFGSARLDRQGGVTNSGVLRLTDTLPNQEGSVIIDTLDSGKLVGSFDVKFKIRTGGGTWGEGFSFNFAPDLPDGPFGEEGAGLGLTVSFDNVGDAAGETPAIDVKFRGASISSRSVNSRTGDSFVDVRIKVDPDGTLDVVFGATTVHANLFAYLPSAGRFGFGARTSERTDAHLLDELSITTAVLQGPFVRTASPSGVGISPDAAILVEFQDFESKVNESSVKLLLNGAPMNATVSKAGETTVVRFQPATLLASGSRNTAEVTYTDDRTPPRAFSVNFDFLIEPYAILPSNWALPSGIVDTSKAGFNIRTVQARADAGLAASIARAEAQLAGTLIDPATRLPFVNEARPGPNSDQTFDEEQVINYEQDARPSGSFSNDRAFPGIPGTGNHRENAAMEIITFLELPAGFHRFGINSDDGFKVTVGQPDPRDAFATVLGQFDGARNSADTTFGFVAEKTGFFAFRLLWFEAGGGANLEFYSVLPGGQKVLINDRSNARSIKAYRARLPGSAFPPIVHSISPKPGEVGVSRRPSIEIVLKDNELQATTASIQLKLDGQSVAPKVSKAGRLTTISYQPASQFPNLAQSRVTLTFQDSANPPNTYTREWDFTTARVISVKGQWDFEDGTLKSPFGYDLAFGDAPARVVSSLTEFGSTTIFGIPDIAGKPAKVMKHNRSEAGGASQPGYLMRHCASPSGGTMNLNQWTLIMDALFPDPQVSPFTALIQLNETTSDGDLFVRWNNIAGEGTGGIGVSGQYAGDGRTSVKVGEWQRLVFAVDLLASPPVISKFVNGVKFQDQTLTPPQIDGRFSLGRTARLFADDDNELNTFYVNSIQVLDGKLADDEVAALGGPAAEGIPLNLGPGVLIGGTPKLSIRLLGDRVALSWPEFCPPYILESTDSLVKPAWKAVAGAADSSANVAIETAPRFFRLRR
ncbi:MAG: hypothetical protein HY735_36905 [Verrucomicrobia bacterium]|nr:hypothetical protein [Verrucomicrobiota bacterium]